MSAGWDHGITWHLELVTAPNIQGDDTLALDQVRDDHIRGANGTAEDAYIQWLMFTTYQVAEDTTYRAHLPQTWAAVLSAFPRCLDGRIVLPKPPLLSVTSITYVDVDGVTQTLTGSPAQFQVIAPSGPKASKGYVLPLYGESWPSTKAVPDAVRVEFQCGYPTIDGAVQVPIHIDQARLAAICEMYQSRTKTVPEWVLADWRRYRAY